MRMLLCILFCLLLAAVYCGLSYGMEEVPKSSLDYLDENLKICVATFFYSGNFHETIKNFLRFAACNKNFYKLASAEIVKGSICNYIKRFGTDPLFTVIQKTLPEAFFLEFLVKYSIPIDSIQGLGGMSPLLLASFERAYSKKHSFMQTINYLISVGSDFDRQLSGSGCTALHYASSHNDVVLMKCLLEHNANPMIRNFKNHLPITIAVDNDCFETAQSYKASSA